MSSLSHSEAGFIKSLQISRYSLFAFVEGKECDSYFYSKICKLVCEPLHLTFAIRMASEIPNRAGGKAALLGFYDSLRKQSSLISEFKGKKTAAIFFLDKDADDIMLVRLESPHLIYSEYYDVQNYLFKYSNLIGAFAAAVSMDPAAVSSHPFFVGSWCARVATLWKEWICVCIFALAYNVKGSPNYRVSSQINTNLNGPVDPLLQGSKIAELQKAFQGSDFAKSMRKARRIVERLYLAGQHDRVFKGKWYCTLAEADLKQAFPGHDVEGCGVRIQSLLMLSLDYGAGWSLGLRASVGAVCAQLL